MKDNIWESNEYLKDEFVFLEQIKINTMDAIIANKVEDAKKLIAFHKHYMKFFSSSGEEHRIALAYFTAYPNKHILKRLEELLSNYSRSSEMEMVERINHLINAIQEDNIDNSTDLEGDYFETPFF